MKALTPHGKLLVYGCSSAALIFLIGVAISLSRCSRQDDRAEHAASDDIHPIFNESQLTNALRDIPDKFPANTHMPRIGEGAASGSIDLSTFSAGRDLVYFDDRRIWWESDHDKNDNECDHSMHRAVQAPLRRLVALVSRAGGTLEVHDAYRPTGVHAPRSLHLEGRAVDVTCDELGLKELAKLCWAAGFDWILYEANARGGAHIHASVRRDNGQETQTGGVTAKRN